MNMDGSLDAGVMNSSEPALPVLGSPKPQNPYLFQNNVDNWKNQERINHFHKIEVITN
jgi:hypothetical protein